MKITGTINTGLDTYLVEFQNSVSEKFICQWDNIQEPLKQLNDNYYLKDIYRFNNYKMKFERVPKNKYKLLFSINTEVMEILIKYNIVK